jgi:GWxTD domain-containing protein
MAIAGAATLRAGDPNAAIGQARQAINARQYDAALKALGEAIPDATALPEPKHSQALAALHFYTALAYSAQENEMMSRQELEEFFRWSPQTKSIDAAKFDPRFVRAFNEVEQSLRKDQTQGSFDAVYPGFALFHDREPKVLKIEEWGQSPDLLLLGNGDEKRAWAALTDNDSRRAYVAQFWTRGDRAAFRKEFLRRVAFADETFGEPRTRGSLTDRGRVFVLIGPPVVIRQKPLTLRESDTHIGGSHGADQMAMKKRPVENFDPLSDAGRRAMAMDDKNMEQIPPTPIAKATVERWIYSRDQFPKGIPDTEVVFKFLTQEGYGDHVLQREFLVNKVLADATTMH